MDVNTKKKKKVTIIDFIKSTVYNSLDHGTLYDIKNSKEDGEYIFATFKAFLLICAVILIAIAIYTVLTELFPLSLGIFAMIALAIYIVIKI